jgi:hypothetical protein
MRTSTLVIEIGVLVAAVAVGRVGCAMNWFGDHVQFERLRSANRVRVRDNSDHELRTITDSETIAALVRFAEAHADGWGVPWYGAPVARIYAQFYEGDRFINDLGVGGDWIGTQHKGYFYSRSVSDDDRAAVMKLLDVPDPYATQNR